MGGEWEMGDGRGEIWCCTIYLQLEGLWVDENLFFWGRGEGSERFVLR